MKLDKQAGYVSGTLIGLVVTIVLLISALGFGTWAFMSRQDYKDNSDEKATKAADERQVAVEKADAAKFAEEEKNPLQTYKGPDQFGSVTVKYPKTWSGYVVNKLTGVTPLNSYFHPGVVPDASDKDNAFSLRVQVLDQPYDEVLKTYTNEIKNKQLKAKPYAFPNVPTVIGTRLSGQIATDKKGSVVLVPMRNLTLKVWTESPKYLNDFNKIVLANLKFSP